MKNKKKTSKKKSQNEDSVVWYVLRGFNRSNKNETGFLSINKPTYSNPNLYEIVDSLENATKFPSKNVFNIKGFGTPQQWFDFFKKEHELANWKFHLMKTKAPKIINKV